MLRRDRSLIHAARAAVFILTALWFPATHLSPGPAIGQPGGAVNASAVGLAAYGLGLLLLYLKARILITIHRAANPNGNTH